MSNRIKVWSIKHLSQGGKQFCRQYQLTLWHASYCIIPYVWRLKELLANFGGKKTIIKVGFTGVIGNGYVSSKRMGEWYLEVWRNSIWLCLRCMDGVWELTLPIPEKAFG
ncbi:hypothetical protein EPI10_031858 [Gossypium australe]|uniref:Uncharacterized protein n=1 Tax=Gossypium australe TaxID=47621 RepID=A0A5B6X599_9ROSI|nr:hypothetical protein EPI10_031858 [Gossypium australe]